MHFPSTKHIATVGLSLKTMINDQVRELIVHFDNANACECVN